MSLTTDVAPPAQTRRGLSATEVIESRRRHGSNVLSPPEKQPWWQLYLEKFEDPVIRILMIAAVIAIVVGAAHGEYMEGVGIIVAILLATALAFANEYKAAREFDVLNKSEDDLPVRVIRDANPTEVPRRDLVVGDLVLIEAGEAVPADGLIVDAVSLQVSEAALTGESVPVSKWASGDAVSAAKGRTLPADHVFRGTTVMDGHGQFTVTAVGNSTKIGGVIVEASEETDEVTPLNQQLSRLSKVIGVVGFGVAALTFTALTLRGISTGELKADTSQWLFATVLLICSMVALVKVWLPIVYDLLELVGRETQAPEWLESEGLRGWLTALLVGAAMFTVIGGGLWVAGVIPAQPGDWLPPAVGEALLKYFMIAVTIIVVAVPEGLAMSVTLSLAYSMRKMTAMNTLVRRMHACETIGAATVICSDKTGTLTTSQMRVHETHFTAAASADHPDGFAMRLIAEAISCNSTAVLDRSRGAEAMPLGNPTESALLMWLDARGVDYVAYRDAFRTGEQLTFSTLRKYMATLGESAVTGNRLVHVKGAPEVLLARCTRLLTPAGVVPLTDARSQIENELKMAQARGMRTLGLAYHEAPGESLDLGVLVSDMTWLGFVSIADPLRPEVVGAIRSCRSAGIDVKIITGDNSETAQEIGRQIGLLHDTSPVIAQMSGAAFAKLNDEQALAACEDIKVLSRAQPEHKRRMVQLLQQRRHVVAVTGDGINDGPALNYADVGLAMGKTGTSVARNASDIILLDDSFASIVNGVTWGRSLYQNIQRFILFQLTINVTALVIALLGPFIGVQIPLTVIQMLWINLIMDTFAALALASEPADAKVLQHPPRRSTDFIVSPAMARSILAVGLTFVVLLVAMLLYMQRDGAVTRRELSIFYTTFVMLQFWNLFNARRLGSSLSAFSDLGANKLFLAIAAAIFLGQVIITQFGGDIFQVEPLGLSDWLAIVLGTSVVLWVGELWRLWNRLPTGAVAHAT